MSVEESEKNSKERYATRFRVPVPDPPRQDKKGPHPFLRRSFIPRPVSAGSRHELCQKGIQIESLESPKPQRSATQPNLIGNGCSKCFLFWNQLKGSRQKISKLENNFKAIMESNQKHVSHNNQMKEILVEAVSELAIIRKDIQFKVEPTRNPIESKKDLEKNETSEIVDSFNEDFAIETSSSSTRDKTAKVERFIHEMSRIEKDWMDVVKSFEVLDEQMVSVGAIQRHLISLAESMAHGETNETSKPRRNVRIETFGMPRKECQRGYEEESLSENEDFFNFEFQTNELDFEKFIKNQGHFTEEEDLINLINM